LFWKGTLIRLPTGFCASLASSVALISACAGAVASSAADSATAAENRVLVGVVIVRSLIEISGPLMSGEGLDKTLQILRIHMNKAAARAVDVRDEQERNGQDQR
jgi:hypothetical protein